MQGCKGQPSSTSQNLDWNMGPVFRNKSKEHKTQVNLYAMSGRMNSNMMLPGLKDIWHFISKLSKAIVSGIPSQKMEFKPTKHEKVHARPDELRQNAGSRKHRPSSRPAAEKQSLLKETKKAKGIHS